MAIPYFGPYTMLWRMLSPRVEETLMFQLLCESEKISLMKKEVGIIAEINH